MDMVGVVFERMEKMAQLLHQRLQRRTHHTQLACIVRQAMQALFYRSFQGMKSLGHRRLHLPLDHLFRPLSQASGPFR